MQIHFSLPVKSINIIFRMSFRNQDWKNREKLSFYFLFFFPLFPAISFAFHLPYFYHFTPFPLLFSFYFSFLFLPSFCSHSIFNSSSYFHSISTLSFLLPFYPPFYFQSFFLFLNYLYSIVSSITGRKIWYLEKATEYL